jgi:hypothetical protein
MLRERMTSLLEMFRVLGLRPRKTSPLKDMKSPQNASIDSTMRQLSVQPGRGDGTEDEEELNDSELDLIYQKLALIVIFLQVLITCIELSDTIVHCQRRSHPSLSISHYVVIKNKH